MRLTKSERAKIDKLAEEGAKKLVKSGIENVEIVCNEHHLLGYSGTITIGRELRASGLAITELFYKGGKIYRQDSPDAMSVALRFECRKILDSFFDGKRIPREEIIESWNGLDCIIDGSKCQPGRKPLGFCNQARCGG